MKFFPIKVGIACLLITPFLYMATLAYCEKYLDQFFSNQVQNILVGDTAPVLQGQVRLEEQVAKNIQHFLGNNGLLNRFDIDLNISVSTGSGKIIYPIFIDVDSMLDDMAKGLDSQAIAKNNYILLNTGLVVKANIDLSHGSGISLLILICFSTLSFFIFYFYYRMGSSKAARERREKAELINALQNKEEAQKKRLEKLKNEQQNLFKDMESLNIKYREDTTKAKINEDEMFGEIISLEEKLNSYIELKQNKEMEIDDLKSQIKKYERRKGSKNKRLDYDFMSKRFAALYKNIIMNRKALSGFLNLNDDQQIKAEEIIFMLDRFPDKVTVKRKVFVGKKHKSASFEVLFAYNGRLYFKKTDTATEVLIIGTKNTQQKDMEFLHHL